MRRGYRRNGKRTRRHARRHLGFFGTLKRYLDFLAG